jgi:DNA polymerase-3 subunit delta'
VTFRDLIGQRHAVMLLQGALRSGRVAHAYLVIGPAGVGRRAVAGAFAQTLLCETGGDDACDRCTACRKVRNGAHPDLRVIAPGGGEGSADRRAVGIDQIRDLKREASYPPYEGRRKVFIIEGAEAMRAEAANSLLKVLEEPPPSVVIVLVAESAAAMLPTLVSRSQVVRCSLVSATEIARALTARAGVPAARARYLAAIAGGRIGVALAAAASGDEAFERRSAVVGVLAALGREDIVAQLAAAETVARARDEVEQWLDTAQLWMRDVIVWQETGDPALLFNLDLRDEVAAWADRIPGTRLRRAAGAIEEARANLRRNLNPRLVLEALFTDLSGAVGAGAAGAQTPPR